MFINIYYLFIWQINSVCVCKHRYGTVPLIRNPYKTKVSIDLWAKVMKSIDNKLILYLF